MNVESGNNCKCKILVFKNGFSFLFKDGDNNSEFKILRLRWLKMIKVKGESNSKFKILNVYK